MKIKGSFQILVFQLAHLVLCWVLTFVYSNSQTHLRFTIKLQENYTETVFQRLHEYNFSRLHQITPSTYIIEYTSDQTFRSESILQSLQRLLGGEIQAVEPVREYDGTLELAAKEISSNYNENPLAAPKRLIVKVRKKGRKDAFKAFKRYNYKLLYTITPETSVFEYQGRLGTYEINLLTLRLKQQLLHKVISIEEVIVYENTLKPEAFAQLDQRVQKLNLDFERSNHYGMGISELHKRGYTGRGVVVAVTDVGIDTDLLDLSENIDKKSSYNFIDNSRDVTPEYFHHIHDSATAFTAHGEQCASIIGSVFKNRICTFGIAYEASIVGLKIFMVTLYNGRILKLEPVYSTRSDIIARALVHHLSEIDIYSNAWAPTKSFATLDLPTKDAIKHGSEKGRHGLGAVYIVPAGPTGNELANNIYTIAVNGVGRNWSLPGDSSVSASVLTSGLADGSNITAKYMLTASQKNKCVTSFKGVSAATAQIAGIVALALEASPRLTLRQLKHIIVNASQPNNKREEFTANAAGHLFHEVFGFGLLDAERLILLAKKSTRPAKLLKRKMKEPTMRFVQAGAQEVRFCYSCTNDYDTSCLDTIEYAFVKMSFTNFCTHIRMVLVSPSGTESVLISFNSPSTWFRNKKIHLTSVHFWDETPFGTWRLLLTYPFDSCKEANILSATLTVYGTKSRQVIQNHTEDISCTYPTKNISPEENNVKTDNDNDVNSIFNHIDLSNLIVVIFGFAILVVIIFVIARLPRRAHFIRKQ